MEIEGNYREIRPIAPYGYMRALIIVSKGKEQSFTVGFKKIEEQIKGLKKGDKIHLDYQNYDKFRIKRIWLQDLRSMLHGMPSFQLRWWLLQKIRPPLWNERIIFLKKTFHELLHDTTMQKPILHARNLYLPHPGHKTRCLQTSKTRGWNLFKSKRI